MTSHAAPGLRAFALSFLLSVVPPIAAAAEPAALAIAVDEHSVSVSSAAAGGAVVLSPEGQTGRVVAQESGAWAGALAFGTAGAKGGACVGSFFGPGPGTAIGAGIGGIGGGIVGAVLGAQAADNVYEATVEDP